MRAPDWLNLLFFSLFMVLAWLLPLARGQRARVMTIGAAGTGLIFAVHAAERVLAAPAVSVIRNWLPAPLTLMVYWQAGQFSRPPNERLQTWLLRLEHELLGAVLGHRASKWRHRWMAEYLEFAYLFCYPLVPLGVGALYLLHLGRFADQYWNLVLPSTYLCYALLPFAQTLPPRMLAQEQRFSPPSTKIRALNLWILRHASIQVNTFPSAHVAATMAASLALIRVAPLAGLGFLWVAISIAVGAVVGRYHYAADALLGTAMAVAVFLIEFYWLG